MAMDDFKCKKCGRSISSKEIFIMTISGKFLIVFGIIILILVTFYLSIDYIMFTFIGIYGGRTILRLRPEKDYCAHCLKIIINNQSEKPNKNTKP